MKTTTKTLLAIALVLGVGIALFRGWGAPAFATTAQGTPMMSLASLLQPDTAWTVGELRPDGLRIVPSGRSDASAVLDPARFDEPRIRAAYAVAQRIPETLNQLYCWCGCVGNPTMGNHRSALECFESDHAANCDVCLANAEIAWEMTEQGVTDAGKIQAAIDTRFARL